MKVQGFCCIIFLVAISCSKNPVDPKFGSEPPNQTFVNSLRIDESIALYIPEQYRDKNDVTATWSCNTGTISPAAHFVLYKAPSHAAKAIVNLQIVSPNQVLFDLNINFLVYKQFIILKADDLIEDKDTVVSKNWLHYIGYIRDKNIKSSLGLIGRSLVKGDEIYAGLVSNLHETDNFEIWNHGYTHYLGKKNNPATANLAEFRNTSFEEQQKSISMTQKLAKEYANITLCTFGAPGNAIDDVTRQVVDQSPEIAVWLFGNPQSTKLILSRSSEIEYPIYKPNYEEFKSRFDAQRNYHVFQIHPNRWDDQAFVEFGRIIDFLLSQDVTFINPHEYYILIENMKKANGVNSVFRR